MLTVLGSPHSNPHSSTQRLYFLNKLRNDNKTNKSLYEVWRIQVLSKMEYRIRASRKQFSIMLDYMERNGDLSRPQPGLQGRLKADHQWHELVKLLNAAGESGIRKPMEKWKRVWSDWKTKTKKKALHFKKKINQGTVDARIRVRTLNPLENRILKLIGLDSLRGQEDEEMQCTIQYDKDQDDDGSEAPTSPETDVQTDPSPLTQPAVEVMLTQTDHQPTLEENFSYANVQVLMKQEVTHDDVAPSPDASQLNEEEETNQKEPTRPPSVCASNPRSRRYIRQRRRYHQTPFEQITSEFVRIEEGRLRLEEIRLQTQHQREMEQLRVESQRLTMEQGRTDILKKIADTVELLLQMRQVTN